MYPILIYLGPVPIRTYGLLIAIGFLVALNIIQRLAKYEKLNSDKFVDASFWALIFGFLGARILYVLTRLDFFLISPLSIFKIWEGGLVFFGGLIVSASFLILYFKKHSIPYWKAVDIKVCGLVVAHAFGRLGCLGAGCCYGKPTGSSTYGLRFYSELVETSLHGVPLHPTQLYESFSLFCLFFVLLFVFKRRTFDGQVALLYLISYSVIRSFIECFRGDIVRGFIIEDWLSTSQFISSLVFLVSCAVLIVRLRKAQQKNKF